MNERNAIGGRTWRSAASAVCAVGIAGVVACGGEGKPAKEATNCPEGSVLQGSDCVPTASSGPSDESASAGQSGSAQGGSAAAQRSDSSSDSTTPSGSSATSGKIPYDKDAVEIELKRAARQIKANCGSATDDNGTPPGPWGKTTASVTLGRNGHVKDVTLPAPYDGQPGGVCSVNAFKKIQFPPYASSSDVVVQWDVELVKPKH